MKIGIDGYEANVARRVGIGRIAHETLKSIYSILKNESRRTVSVVVFLPTKPLPDMPVETDFWKYHVTGPGKLWTFIGLPMAMKSEHLDVMYSPTHYIPRFTSVPRVAAIMDLSYLKFPQLFKPKDLYQLTHWTAYSAAHAKKIFTISQASKNDIIKAYRIPDDRVVVTYPGFTMNKVLPTKMYKNYILSVGTLQPRKNYVRLIEAFSIFLKQNRQKFGNLQLVIIGKKGWLYDDILAAPKKFGVAERVKFMDFVPDSELPSFYQHALCFALPSLYEGFGLPVLEAMAYKCPVVVSNVSSLPEIAGNAGIYVDAGSTESIANGLLTAVRQRNLVQGRQRVNAGLAQMKKFTWEKAAKETLDVLEQIAKQGGKFQSSQ
jgi:glycosyltransferase involved in cell wall biosynthesis